MGWRLLGETKQVKNNIEESIKEHIKVIESILGLNKKIITFADKLIDTLILGNKILIMGNGGSASDSQHFAAELVGRYKKTRKGLPALALTTDTSIITSIGNDFSFDEIFKRQIEAFAKSGDLVIGISTSGNSKNIIEGIKEAKKRYCYTVGLLGNDGGELKDIVDLALITDSNDTARIQESHIFIIHIVCDMVESNMYEIK